MSITSKSILTSLAFFTILIGIYGCDTTIEPFEDEQGIFSIYGAVEVGKDQNIIRVRNLLEPFNPDSSFELDANIIFTDLQTGTETQLRDTVIQFPVGNTYNFILDQELELDSQYQITVERKSDGATSSSIATTPGLTEVSFAPFEFIRCETPIRFRFKNVKPSEFVRMEIGAEYQNEIHWGELDLVGDIEFDPQLDLHTLNLRPRNLLVEVFTPQLPDNPFFDPLTLFPTVNCNELSSNTIKIRYKHFGPEWDTGLPIEDGLIDTDSGDIENGLGFFGAFREDTFSFEITEEEEDNF